MRPTLQWTRRSRTGTAWPKRRRQQGVSLLEVLVAMTVFALVASGMASMAATSLRATADNRAASAAHMLGQDELERVRGLQYADIASESKTVTMMGLPYAVTTLVSDNDPAAGMKRIRVEVDWTGPLGARSYDLQTIFTDVQQ